MWMWMWLATAFASDCSVAQEAQSLAMAQGQDPAPFQQLVDRVCAEEPKQRGLMVVPRGRRTSGAIPFGTKVMVTESSDLEKVGALPMGLKVLDLGGTKIERLPALPLTLKALSVRDAPVKKLPALPMGLEVLDLRGTALSPRLPGSVKCVVVDAPSGPKQVSDLSECAGGSEFLRALAESPVRSDDVWE